MSKVEDEIKKLIEEQNYVKNEELKQFFTKFLFEMEQITNNQITDKFKDLLEMVNKTIAETIKLHIVEINKFLINKFNIYSSINDNVISEQEPESQKPNVPIPFGPIEK